jgi:hypothetical protein
MAADFRVHGPPGVSVDTTVRRTTDTRRAYEQSLWMQAMQGHTEPILLLFPTGRLPSRRWLSVALVPARTHVRRWKR